MEEIKCEKKEKTPDKPTIKKRSFLKKLDPDSAKILQSLKDKVNKKPYGRKVKDSEIIAKALSLIDAHHLSELQDATLSEKDRLHMAHEDFTRQHGKISLDQFIGRLLKGEIRVKDQ